MAAQRRILRTLHEDQIFRIDHFLGKDTVQSIMAFRFANGLFEPIWNRDRIDHVQITAAETVGVEAARQVLRGDRRAARHGSEHVFTLLSMVAMEPPTGFDAAAIRSKKAEVLRGDARRLPTSAVRGQYGAGKCGKQVEAYRDEPDVARIQTSRPMWRCSSKSTIGDGPACRSIPHRQAFVASG